MKCKYSLVLLLIHVTNPWKRKRMRKWGFYEYFFSTLTLIYKWKEHQLFFFSIWINGWSINQSSVEYQQKSLIIAFSNTVESKVALRRPWQDYRQTKHAMEQVRCIKCSSWLFEKTSLHNQLKTLSSSIIGNCRNMQFICRSCVMLRYDWYPRDAIDICGLNHTSSVVTLYTLKLHSTSGAERLQISADAWFLWS